MPEPLPADSPLCSELLAQVERLLHSPVLSGTEILRNLLLFLARAAVDRPGDPIRESEIAQAVLGRRDFDARVDSGVRVHTARLRAKLAEYYVSQGANDPLILEIPKRSYQLTCRQRLPADSAPGDAVPPPPHWWSAWRTWAPWSIAGLASALALALFLAAQANSPSSDLRRLWAPFLDPHQSPVVVFATPRLVSVPGVGLQWVPNPAPPGPPLITEYTGVGELVAVSRLTRLFDRLSRDILLKRSEMVTWDDARQQNLILVGGPDTNVVLANLPPRPSRFAFGFGNIGPNGASRAAIVDLRAPEGPSRYFGNSGRPFLFDHALIRFTAVPHTGRPLAILAGTTTMGTQAAGEFVTDPVSVHRLLAALHASSGPVPPFEALLKVNLRGGIPVSTDLLAAQRIR